MKFRWVCGVCLLFVVGPAQAASGWRICNHTSFIAEVAAGRPGDQDISVRGWLRLRPGQCRQAAPAPLVQIDHYMFARSSEAHRGGPRVWGGDVPLCVRTEGAFSLQAGQGCSESGYAIENFQSISIGHASGWTTRLLEIGEYDLGTAQAAGIQRLLVDVGAGKTAIDGYIGRRTRKEINAFIKEKKLPARTSDRDLIDVLEAEAIKQAQTRGMTLCNGTDHRVWAAIAHLVDEEWESRGWWNIGAGRCARVLDGVLGSEPYYVLAEIRGEEGVRRLAGASHEFCVSQARFIIAGRRRCQERYYDTAVFAQTGKIQDGHLRMEMFDEDFARPTPDN